MNEGQRSALVRPAISRPTKASAALASGMILMFGTMAAWDLDGPAAYVVYDSAMLVGALGGRDDLRKIVR